MNVYEKTFIKMCSKEVFDIVGVLLNYIDINAIFAKSEHQIRLSIIRIGYDENLIYKILNQLKKEYILSLWDHCRYNVLVSSRDNHVYNKSLNIIKYIELNRLHEYDDVPPDYTLNQIATGGKGYWIDGRTHQSI